MTTLQFGGSDPKVNGRSPLHRAASEGAGAVVELLLELGADPAATDNNGAVALHLAAAAGHVAVFELLEALPGHDAEDGDGRTVLETAVRHARLTVVAKVRWYFLGLLTVACCISHVLVT